MYKIEKIIDELNSDIDELMHKERSNEQKRFLLEQMIGQTQELEKAIVKEWLKIK